MSAQLQREETLEREVHDLEGDREEVDKHQYERLKDCVERCLQYLSRDHWCYMKLCYLLAHYHYQLSRRARSFASDLLQLAVLWGRKYSTALVRTKTAEHAPMKYVEWQYWLSLICGDWPHLLQEKISLLEATYPTYSTIYPNEDATKNIAKVLEESQRRVMTYRNKVFLGKAYKQLRYEYDESELFSRWEDMLADSYMAKVKSHPNSGLDALLRDGRLDPSENLSA
eukprot:TRINITY_DN13454_c0_g1_i1.p1 TRINITY_DN13454_c0_g1~~TRINITY_DN13454_c0_g1_i1.p1  ORF type:complete len:227 (+),score=102.67 TRINITY_DN13454_c0_g1_i1:418-1098(+)